MRLLYRECGKAHLRREQNRSEPGSVALEDAFGGKRRSIVDAKRGELQSIRQVLPDGDVYFRNVRYGYEFTVKTVSHEN